MANQPTVCLTGFISDPKLEDYIQSIEKLNCKHVKKMCQVTQLLIVKNTATQKYKIAKLNREPIICVTINWLLDSKKKKKILPYTSYEIPHIFYGVHVSLSGFQIQEAEKLKKILTENGATVKVFPSIIELNDFEEIEDNTDALVTTQKQLQRLGPKASEFSTPLVGIDWIESSLRHKMCKWPRDYALNYQYLKKGSKSIECQIPKLSDRLKMFSKGSLFDREFEFLREVRVFIDQSVSYKVSPLLKKIVRACGGIQLINLSYMVSHVVTSSITENNYIKHLKYGNAVKVVRVEWLIDSIYLYKKLDQEDYKVRQFETKYTKADSIQGEANKHPQSSNFHTNPLQLLRPPSRNSISMTYQMTKTVKVQNVTTKFKSTIFKGCNFYIDPLQKKERPIMGLGTKIRQNGGTLYDGVSKSIKRVYVTLSDSQLNQEILKKLQKFRENIIPVSYRWINHCIQNCQITPANAQSFYIFRPLPFRVPIKEFMSSKFQILTKDDIARRRIRQLLTTLGNAYVSVNKVNLTHCICLKDYQSVQKYNEIRKVNPKVIFIKFDWILACVRERKFVDTNDYLCNE